MDHATAEVTRSVERYLLGELSPQERDEFEAHAFDCLQCAEDLTAGAAFVDNYRSVIQSPPPESDALLAAAAGAVAGPAVGPSPTSAPAKSPRTIWWTRKWTESWASAWWQPAFVLPALLVVSALAIYQNVKTIPDLRRAAEPQTLSSFSLASSGTRSGGVPVIATAPDRPFMMFFDIPPEGRFAAYRCAIVSADGAEVFAIDASAAQARDTIQLLVPASRLHPGAYTLVITGRDTADRSAASATAAGGAEREVARYPFLLQAASAP